MWQRSSRKAATACAMLQLALRLLIGMAAATAGGVFEAEDCGPECLVTLLQTDLGGIVHTPSGGSGSHIHTHAHTRTQEVIRGLPSEDERILEDPQAAWQVLSLQFLHIPKNAGTAVEESALDATPAVHWGKYSAHLWNMTLMPDGHSCRGWHVPPKFHDKAAEFYTSAGVDEVFCLTRDPLKRVVSEYNYKGLLYLEFRKGECTRTELNYFLKGMLQKVKSGEMFIGDCHFVPQFEYIYGYNGKQWCDTVLPISGFPANFNQLMVDRGFNITVGEKPINDSSGECDMTVDDLDAETVQMIEEVYALDYEHVLF